MTSFFLIFQNVFLAFILIPITSGSYYKIGAIFLGSFPALTAKLSGIMLALSFNYIFGRFLRKISKKELPKLPKFGFLLLLSSFVPVISGIVSFYFGILKYDFKKFFAISLSVNFLYYFIAIYFPFLNIYF